MMSQGTTECSRLQLLESGKGNKPTHIKRSKTFQNLGTNVLIQVLNLRSINTNLRFLKVIALSIDVAPTSLHVAFRLMSSVQIMELPLFN